MRYDKLLVICTSISTQYTNYTPEIQEVHLGKKKKHL